MARPRKTRIETPGEDEAKPNTPTPEQVQASIVNKTPLPAGESFVEEVTEEAKKGNVVHVQHGHQPKIGDKWAGMVLTKHGWATPPDNSEE